jgi:hypothetical protein
VTWPGHLEYDQVTFFSDANLIGVFGVLLDRFGRPRVEQDLVGQEDPGKSTAPAG